MEEKLLSFDYYLSKVPMYLKQNDTFTQHFKIWYDMLVSSNESFDTILNLLDIFSEDYNTKYLSGDNPVASNLLEKLANLFNIGHDFSVINKEYQDNLELTEITLSTLVYSTDIWTDGNNTYYSYETTQLKFNENTQEWENMTWTGLTSFDGRYVWKDSSNNIYYSYGSSQYVLDKSTNTWSTTTWTREGSYSFTPNGKYIWNYNGVTYCFFETKPYGYIYKAWCLTNPITSWYPVYNVNENISGDKIWTDNNNNIYFSNNTYQYVLDKPNSTYNRMTWNEKTWNISTGLSKENIFKTNENIYLTFYDSTEQAVKSYILYNNSWEIKNWNGEIIFADNVWHDLHNTYFNKSSSYVYKFVSTLQDKVFELNLTDEELLILLKSQIIKNNFNGTYEDVRQFYNQLGWTIIYQVNTSASAVIIFVGKSGSNLSENLQKCWNAGLLSVNSLGINYTYNVINNYDVMGFWGISKWDEGEWSV